MDLNDLTDYFRELPDRVMDAAAEIVADTATEYFKERFTEKEFDGNPWAPGRPKKKGSLLVNSGALLNSIRPTIISREKVRISAGDLKVDYASVHNEGFQGSAVINPFTRKNGVQVKGHTRQMNIPKRQFLGNSKELAKRIHDRCEKGLNTLLKND